MALLDCSHVSVRYPGATVLGDVTLAVDAGDRIGVIGPNGSGKSTLLNVLAGRMEPSGGGVTRQRGVSIGHQEQELEFAPEATVLDEMRRVFHDAYARARRLRHLEDAMASAASPEEREAALREYERIQREHETAGGYGVERRIETVLTSLGLPESSWNQPVAAFSGGERKVIGLARVLLSDPDVLLLDEPSNHLDMEGVEWFIQFLNQTDAAVVLVSHDRHLLDATTKEIWEVGGGKVAVWAGNYSQSRQRKAEALALLERRYKVQQRAIERLSFQARRLRDFGKAYDDPGQARRAKAMFKRIERMEKVERPSDGPRRFHAHLQSGARHGRIALSVSDFTFAYDERVLFDKASLEIEFGERVCLVGPNGCGKTTFLRQVLDHGSWERRDLRLGKSVRVGEYRQLHEDALDPTAHLLDWTAKETGQSRSEAQGLLHRFLFDVDDLDRPIGTLSGGEKSRLQIARLVHRKVNLLVLDEPTNHLDLDACEQLEGMLGEFAGTLLVVSHDRFFLERIITRVVEVVDKKLVSHLCGFAEWWEGRKATMDVKRRRSLELSSRKDAAADSASSAREEREERKARERERRRRTAEIAALERSIEEMEERRAALAAEMERAYGPEGDVEKANRLHEEFERLGEELSEAYARWEAAAESDR